MYSAKFFYEFMKSVQYLFCPVSCFLLKEKYPHDHGGVGILSPFNKGYLFSSSTACTSIWIAAGMDSSSRSNSALCRVWVVSHPMPA